MVFLLCIIELYATEQIDSTESYWIPPKSYPVGDFELVLPISWPQPVYIAQKNVVQIAPSIQKIFNFFHSTNTKMNHPCSIDGWCDFFALKFHYLTSFRIKFIELLWHETCKYYFK